MSKVPESVRTDAYGDPLPPRTVCRIGSQRLSHPGVLALAFSRDSKQLASAGLREIRFWSAETGARTRVADVGIYGAQTIAFDAKGNLGAASAAGLLTTWSRTVATPRYGSYAHQNGTIAWQDGAWLVRAGIRLYRVSPAHQQTSIRLEGITRESTALASIGGTRVAVVRADGVIQFCRVDDGAAAGDLFCGLPPTAIAVGPTGETLVAGFADGRVGVWDIPTERQLSEWPAHELPVSAVALSPDGKTIATGSSARIRLWSAATGAETLELATFDEPPARISFHPDAPRVVTRSGLRLQEWDAESGALLSELPARGVWDDGSRMPDTRYVVLPADTGVWAVWDVAVGRELGRLESTGTVASVSPDGTAIALGGPGPRVRLVSFPRGKERWSYRFEPPAHLPTFVRFLPDGSLLAGRTFEDIQLLSPEGEPRLGLWGPVALSRDGEWMAASHSGKGVHVYKRSNRHPGWTLEATHAPHPTAILAFAFAPFGKLLASACSEHVKVWRLEGRPVLHHSQKTGGGAHDLSFSADGRRLATVSWTSGEVLVRDVPPL